MTRSYDYVQYDEDAARKSQLLKLHVEELHGAIDRFIKPGRERSLAFTRLEEVWMRCGRALRDEVIARDPDAKNVPARSDA